MDKEDLLKNIEIVLPKLKQWIAYKNVSLDNSEREIIVRILKQILPNSKHNFSCGGCVGELLITIFSYYQREKE